MFITSTITALLAAPSLFMTANLAVQDAQEEARVSYNNCLVDEHNIAVQANMPVGAFEKDAASKCTAQRKAYYDIIYKTEKADGVSNSEADEYATEECNGVLEYIVREYAANLESKAELIKS